MTCRTFWGALLFAIWIALLPARTALADLSAGELVLIVNRNVPQSRQLADFYAQARDVPEGRILELDLPAGDRLSREQYEQVVVPKLRQFLLDNALREQVRCAVSFYGVPLIVEGKKLTAAERQERAQVDEDAQEVAARLAPLVREAEQALAQAGYQAPPMRPGDTQNLEALLQRLGSVENFSSRQAAERLTEEQRRALAASVASLRERFSQPFAAGGGAADPAEFAALMQRSDEPARRQVREMLRKGAPMKDYAALLHQHQRLLAEEQSDACFDSELATLWIHNAPAAGWLMNPLARGALAPAQGRPVVLMTSRLDGRDPQQVRDIIATGLRVERDGLWGKIVIDSRGIAAEGANGQADGYGVFDEQLRRLARFLEENAKLTVVHDQAPEVIQPPGQTDVAVYVGWYSLTKYVAAFDFAEGAIGYHVASFEMRSLRDPKQPGWVRGLLDDGVVATMGPVSEPYLLAFPPPGEFVPLLITGELALAEVYWHSVPVMSWKLGLVGDPLYRPFAARPGLAVESLPPPLKLRLPQVLP